MTKDLLHVGSLNAAAEWLASFSNRCTIWVLKEKVVVEGRTQYKHERLRTARRGLEKLARAGTLFTYLDEELAGGGDVPATNNMIEGGVNRQLRSVLSEHRGLKPDRRIKAVFWWRYLHTECPLAFAEILRTMPADATVAEFYQVADSASKEEQVFARSSTVVQWSDLHASGRYRVDWD